MPKPHSLAGVFSDPRVLPDGARDLGREAAPAARGRRDHRVQGGQAQAGHRPAAPCRTEREVVEDLARWLGQVQGAFCDGCVARSLGLRGRADANRATRRLAGQGHFYRDLGQCAACDRQRRVIQSA